MPEPGEARNEDEGEFDMDPTRDDGPVLDFSTEISAAKSFDDVVLALRGNEFDDVAAVVERMGEKLSSPDRNREDYRVLVNRLRRDLQLRARSFDLGNEKNTAALVEKLIEFIKEEFEK